MVQTGVLIQANVIPEVKEVHLGWIDVNGEGMTRFAADMPHTPRPTGHESWIGPTDRIFSALPGEARNRIRTCSTSASGM